MAVSPTTSRRQSGRRIVLSPPPPDPRLILARRWALWAGIELAHGHYQAAEHLAHQAERLREGRL